MRDWNRIWRKGTVLLSLTVLAALFFAYSVFAGWNMERDGSAVTYTDDSGNQAVGLLEIDGRVYWFDQAGNLQTGWVTTPEGIRYFDEKGKAGSGLGSMVSGGVVKIGEELFGFDAEGIVLAGFQTWKKDSYYFSTSEKPGERGRAVTDAFQKLPDGRKAYFLSDGRMAVDQWVKDDRYYVDSTGNLLRNWVTKEGYVLGSDGKAGERLTESQFVKLDGKKYFYKKNRGLLKDKVFSHKGSYYYVDQNGVRKKGWITWKSKQYYFGRDAAAVTGKTKVDGIVYTFNSKGELKGKRNKDAEKKNAVKANILILCGHGQGDSGAVGCNGQYVESSFTRDFGKRVYNALLEQKGISADLFNTKYDMFQQVRATLNSSIGTGSFTGTGKRKSRVLKALKKNTRIPKDLTQYDYVLEIHFNATVPGGKDPGGNGSKKGTGTFVNSHKSSANRKIDRKIIKALNGVGLNTWGSGVFGRSDLLNAKTFTEIGINYSLLETCFIDDRDDMKFYLKKRDKMAQAVAKAIAAYFG